MRASKRSSHDGRLMRVAYYSPLPPSRSGIADYSTLLLPALRERVDIVVAHPGKRRALGGCRALPRRQRPGGARWIVDALYERPGVVVLHEFVLHHLVAGTTIGRGNGRGYLDAMERDLGVAGRLLGLGVLDNLLPLLWETQPERFPLSGIVLDHARGLIVHSDYVAQRAREAGYDGRLWRIPHPVWQTPRAEPATDVGGDPLIGCFGFLNMNKRIHSCSRRSPRSAEQLRRQLLLVGGAGERFDVGRRLERLGLTEGVERLDYVPEEQDVVADGGLRRARQPAYPTMGETSGSVVRALGLGKPLLVSDVGWFSELPDDAVLKIPVDDFEVPMIEAALGFAVEHGTALGAAARTYVEREHSLRRTGSCLRECLEDGGRSRRRRRRGPLADRRGGNRGGDRRPGAVGARGRRGRHPRLTPRAAARSPRVSGSPRSSSPRSPSGSRSPASGFPMDHGRRADYSNSRSPSPNGGQFSFAASPSPGYGVVYPALISPAFRTFDSVPDAYHAVKIDQLRRDVARRRCPCTSWRGACSHRRSPSPPPR